MNVPLPDGAKLVSQILWGSIGWSVGTTLGAAFAARECAKDRVVLFVGEGSLCVIRQSNPEKFLTTKDRQLTVQELSPMIRHGLTPILFVINNAGYTIEKFIHGKYRYVRIV